MRRLLPLLALPLLLLPARAHAHDDYDSDYDEPSSDRAYRKAEIGVALEASRSASSLSLGPGVTGGYLGMHARLGRRVALGFGLEQAYGDDPSGFKRSDIGWNLPKLYMYLNPRSATQLYVTTGLDMRISHFDSGPSKPLPEGTPWGLFYFGTFFGGGVEHRVDKQMALRLELRGFLRGRASGNNNANGARLDPELNDLTTGARGVIASVGLVFF